MPDIATGFYTQSQPNALLGTAEQAAGLKNMQAQNALFGYDALQARQNLVQNQVQYLAGGLGILAKKPDLSQADMVNFAQNALKEGIISPDVFQTEMATVQAAGNDPVKLQALAGNYAQRALDAGQKFQSTYGVPTSQDTGPATVYGNTNQQTGAFTPSGGAVLHGLSPAQGTAQVTVTMPDGSHRTMTQAQFVQATGANPLTGASQAPANSSSGGSSPASDGSAQPAQAGIPAPSPQQQEMFKASTAQYQKAKEDAASYQANLVPLEKSLELVGDTPLVGRGSQIPTQIAQVFNTFGIPLETDQAKNAAELDKYLSQLALSGGLAGNSVQHLEATFSANPNMETPRASAQDVLKTGIALLRMRIAAPKLAQLQGMDTHSQDYTSFAQNFGTTMDPRAFGVDMMDPAAKASLLKELQANPDEKAKFAASLRAAQQAGVLGGIPGAE